MAIDEFTQCYAGHVGATVSAIEDDLHKLGPENIQQFLNWWRGLRDSDRGLILFFAGVTVTVSLKIIEKATGEFVAACIGGLISGAGLALCVRAFTECEHLL